MSSDDLGAWLEERFGTRDDRLVTDPDLAEPLVAAREELVEGITGAVAAREELRETYRESLERAASLDRDDDRFDELVREAKLAKKRHRRPTTRFARLRRRLTAVLVVDAFRSFDGVQDLDTELSDALYDRFSAAERDVPEIERTALEDERDTVLDAFAFDVEVTSPSDASETTGFPGEHTGRPPGERAGDGSDIFDDEEIEIEAEKELPDLDDVCTDG